MNTVKHGDTHAITFTVKDSTGTPVDLTGSTVRVLAVPVAGGSLITLSSSLGGETGTVVHNLTGSLDVGTYNLEVEVTDSGVITTAPSEGYASLNVVADLG